MVLLSVKSIKGRRDYMEDRYAYLEDKGITVAMICDGHGGYKVASETVNNLPRLLLNELAKTKGGTNVTNAKIIRRVIMNWGNKVKNYKSGSTLTGIAVKDDTVYVYNIGDSRTCMRLKPGSFAYMLRPLFDNSGEFVEKIFINYSQARFFCTVDHDSDCLNEVGRVRATGGMIANKRLNGILSVTRALGDGDIGTGISHIPDIFWVNNDNVDSPIVLYSDGIYELQRYNKNVNFEDQYLHHLASNFDAASIVDYAFEKGSDDNLTAMVVKT